MHKLLSFLSLVAAFAVLPGCASHPIEIFPALNQLNSQGTNEKIDKVVGYYISAADKGTRVTTPGGGGENVSYFPYRDTELAFRTLLKAKFSAVHVLSNMGDAEALSSKNISYIFRPKITTNSSSESLMSWPPTNFTFELSCIATNPSGETVWSKTVKTKDKAVFPENKGDPSLSARRASEKAFVQMLDEVKRAEIFN